MELKTIAENSKASQGAKELEWLLEKVAVIKPQAILEIGVHQGYSLETWNKAFKPKVLIGVDNDLHDLKWEDAHILAADSHLPSTLGRVKKILSGRKVDFLFIDGDHTYDGVRQDYLMYAPLVRAGGIIAFDDMDLDSNPLVDVYKFWPGVASKHKSEFIHKDSNGIGVIYV